MRAFFCWRWWNKGLTLEELLIISLWNPLESLSVTMT